ncbi:tyrosine-protein kinase abl-1 isoform X2 [Drosophila novamexicana]|uniref:tyrosine-protein kinase abl-1 isoform X2 n=1 Tax=Drosophila novamexicana TaxID=47314 RepID=UPI0011E59E81|nr:tyrosine-protein kinase abl-1 isoform X2 [Drosophila novamexicana]
MGRLFQYNRFGATESVNKRKKDTQKKAHDNAKLLRNVINCPSYSDVYGTNAGKNLDLAFNKCQQWSNKLQPTTEAAPAAAAAEEPAQSRTHKVYDSMKNFLQRKLFAQPSQKERVQCEEPTSDYDEDLLDSSYHADAEEDEEELVANCSCSSSSSPKRVQHNNKSPQKSLLSLNCWQSSQPSDTSSSSSSEEAPPEDHDESDAGISDCCQLINEHNNSSSSSARRRSTPRRRATARWNSNSDDEEDVESEEEELLQCAWYQPRISAKAAQEHLQSATPGSFLLRRSTPRRFELCLRLEHKVKCYAVQCSRSEMYSLKGAKKQFSTLKALITHHSVMAEQLPLTLDMPRERDLVKSAAVRYADDFEPLESLQLLGILKSLQAKNFEA